MERFVLKDEKGRKVAYAGLSARTMIAALGKLEPGDAEEKLAEILRPQDVNFLAMIW
jgi:hypothetical protein